MTASELEPRRPYIHYPPARRGTDWLLIVFIGVVLVAMLIAFARPAWALRIALITVILASCAAAAWWVLRLMSRTVPEQLVLTPPPAETTEREAHGGTARAIRGRPPLAVSELQHPKGVAGLSNQGMRYLQFVATEKLWAKHQLNLQYPPHHASIITLVSPALWRVIDGQPLTVDRHAPNLTLGQLLHEIEDL